MPSAVLASLSAIKIERSKAGSMSTFCLRFVEHLWQWHFINSANLKEEELKNSLGIGLGKENVMFGRMIVTPILQVGRDADLETAITSLSRAAEQAEIGRWIEFPNSVLLFLLVPEDPESGAVYILDRKTGTWCSVDFDDQQYGGYSVSQFEELLRDCHFLDLVERPGLWRTGFSWYGESGKRP